MGRNTTQGNSRHTQMVKTTDSHSTTPTPTPTQYTVSEQADVTSAPKYGKRADRFVVWRESRTEILGGGEIMFHRRTVITNPKSTISSSSSSKGHFYHYISSVHGLITWRKG